MRTTAILPALLAAALATTLGLAACSQPPSAPDQSTDSAAPSESGAPTPDRATMQDASDATSSDPSATEVATFGAGCFWCVEAVLEQIRGVESVVSGYMGGKIENPTYQQVCTGLTGHAEVVQVRFDPAVVSSGDLVDLFWDLHDPTQLNRQGADVGTQYRSAIFFHDEDQRRTAEASKAAAQANFSDPIVTEIEPASTFYEAEEYHQDYYFANKNSNPYCRAVITPKLKKLGLKY